ITSNTGTHITIQNCIFDGYAKVSGASMLYFEQGPNYLLNNLIVDRGTTIPAFTVAIHGAGAVIASNTIVQITPSTTKAGFDAGNNLANASNTFTNNIVTGFNS